jgi:uncharacterized membrane protein HdeD (DUF308 family)
MSVRDQKASWKSRNLGPEGNPQRAALVRRAVLFFGLTTMLCGLGALLYHVSHALGITLIVVGVALWFPGLFATISAYREPHRSP